MVNVFYVPVFFIIFRETLETAIIVSVLLAFLRQTLGGKDDPVTYKKLVRQVWVGTGLGLAICIVIGCGMIGAFYSLKKNAWAGTEEIWEGVFALVASIIISVMGAALLRVSKLQDKWRVKLAAALEAKEKSGTSAKTKFKHLCEKYAMFVLPFITVLREGLEAVIFIGGVGIGQPASSFPIPVLTGLLAGSLVGYAIYRGSKFTAIQIWLIISTCFLYLVAAGLFSKSVWFFEANEWNKLTGGDAAENGAGPGSYDIRKSVWHVNCCSPQVGGGGGWGVFNSLFGWQNSASYGSVISYNIYWIFIIACFVVMRISEKRGGLPFTKRKYSDSGVESDSSSGDDHVTTEKGLEKKQSEHGEVTTKVSTVS